MTDFIILALLCAVMLIAYYARILYERTVILATQRDGALAEMSLWRQRANMLEAACARKDGIMQNYLREAEQLQATIAELERPANSIAAILMRRRVEPERN